MRPVLFLAAAAAAALVSAPASSQSAGGEYVLPIDGNFVARQAPAVRGPGLGRCFDGQEIAGVTRSGDTLYVQSVYPRTREPGRIFRMQLADGCDGLAAARNLELRTNGSPAVCEGVGARVQFDTPAGYKSCKVGQIRVLNRTEVAQLSQAPRR